jgi:hypothetical protein
LRGRDSTATGVTEGEAVAVAVKDDEGVTAISYQSRLKSHHPSELDDEVTAMKYDPPDP